MAFILASELALWQPVPPDFDSNPEGKRLTWPELMQRDARLAALAAAVKVTQAGRDFCANTVWYAGVGFKAQLCEVVGFTSENPDAALRTPAAYDVAYQHLYRLLPDCRHDGMCGPYR